MSYKKQYTKIAKSEFVVFKVLGPVNSVLLYQMRKHTPLRKLMNAHCYRKGLLIQLLDFRFNGQPVIENDTSASLGIKDGDTIEVYTKIPGDTESAESEYVGIKILGPVNSVVLYKIKKHNTLREVLNLHSDRAGLSMQLLKFHFNGQQINENDTPISLEVKEGDTIEISKKIPGDTNRAESEHVGLKVLGPVNFVLQYKIKKHTPLRKLMNAHCYRVGLSIQLVEFRFNGQPVVENDTPASLQMKEGDKINVCMKKPKIIFICNKMQI